jgi:hypothetical protein
MHSIEYLADSCLTVHHQTVKYKGKVFWTQNTSSSLQHFSDTILHPFFVATPLRPLTAHYNSFDHAVYLVSVTINGKAGADKTQQT